MNRILLYANKKQAHPDGTCNVYVCTVVRRVPVRFNTGVRTDVKLIDFKNGYLKGNSKDIADKNLIIENCRARINDIFVRYRLRFADLTPDLLRREYEDYTQNFLFHDYALAKLEQRKILLSIGRIRHHRSVIEKINAFAPNLYLSGITEDFVMRLTAWCRRQLP
jgi:hypothetical protein